MLKLLVVVTPPRDRKRDRHIHFQQGNQEIFHRQILIATTTTIQYTSCQPTLVSSLNENNLLCINQSCS
jgi:methylglyoxal synthase